MFLVRAWLYAGKFRETQDLSLLRQHSIAAMLQLAESVEQPHIVSLYVPVEDGDPIPPAALRQGVDFVRSQKALGNTVLIACGAGISRTATFVIAVLKEEEHLSLLEAFRQLRAGHGGAIPHPTLWESLCEYYGEDVPYSKLMENLRPVL